MKYKNTSIHSCLFITKYIALFLIAGFAFLFLQAQHAQAQTLVLSSSSIDGQKPHFWWQNTQNPILNDLDNGIIKTLQSRKLSIIDPSKVSSAPKISRIIYAKPSLSIANAKNLAQLYNAKNVIQVYVKTKCHIEIEFAQWICSADITLNATHKKLTAHQTIQRAIAPTRSEAITKLNDHIILQIANDIAPTAKMSKIDVDTTKSPTHHQNDLWTQNAPSTLIIHGIDSPQKLAKIKQRLRSDLFIHDVSEIWASHGIIALKLENNSSPITAIMRDTIVEKLSTATSPNGMTLRSIEIDKLGHHVEVIELSF